MNAYLGWGRDAGWIRNCAPGGDEEPTRRDLAPDSAAPSLCSTQHRSVQDSFQTVLLLHSVLHNTGQFKPVSASAARWRYSPPKNEYLAVSCFYFNHLAGKIMPIFLFISSQFPCFKPYLYENWWNWRWKLWFGSVVLSAVRWGLKLNWQHWFLSECSCGSEMERFQWEHFNILAFLFIEITKWWYTSRKIKRWIKLVIRAERISACPGSSDPFYIVTYYCVSRK